MAVATRPRHAMPADVRQSLTSSGRKADYDSRPPYQRNDYLGWIGEAKTAATRDKRIAQMIDELRRGDVYMKMPWRGGDA